MGIDLWLTNLLVIHLILLMTWWKIRKCLLQMQ
jgi:hypothetical protein